MVSRSDYNSTSMSYESPMCNTHVRTLHLYITRLQHTMYNIVSLQSGHRASCSSYISTAHRCTSCTAPDAPETLTKQDEGGRGEEGKKVREKEKEREGEAEGDG